VPATAMITTATMIAATAMVTATVVSVATVVATAMTVNIAVIITATTAVEAMTTPAMAIAPVSPGTYAEEDAVVEVAGTVVSVGCASIGGIIVVPPRARRRRTTNRYPNLGPANGHTYPDLRASRCRRERQAS